MGDMADWAYDRAFDHEGEEEDLNEKQRRNKMSTTQETLTIQGATKYGVKANGSNYYISKFLAKEGISASSFIVGAQYAAEIYTGEKGGKYINKILGNVAQATQIAPPPMPPIPTPPPMLPNTTVAATQAPGGDAVVKPMANGTNGKHTATTEDKMSKADWADRNREIAIQAVIKSSIESPALGEHVSGKSKVELFALTREFIKENLTTYRMAVDGTL